MLSLSVSAQRNTFRSLLGEDGLGSNSVMKVLKDNKGFMYIGTMAGVDRFDGSNVVNILFDADLSNNDYGVNDMIETGGNELLIGNRKGLWQLNKKALTISQLFEKTIDFEVNALARSAATGRIYVGTARGLFCIDNGKLHRLPVLGGGHDVKFDIKDIAAVRKAGKDVLWLVGNHELICFEGQHKLKRYARGSGFEGPLLRVAVSRDAVYVASGTDGIGQLDTHKGIIEQLFLNGCSIEDIAIHGRQLIATTYEEGIKGCNLDTHETVTLYDRHNIRFNTPCSFYRDKDGTDWIGYRFFGLDYTLYNRHIFDVFSIPCLFDSRDFYVRSFAMGDGLTLLGTRNGLFVIDERQHHVEDIGYDKLRSNIVSQVVFDAGKFIIGTIGAGTYIYDSRTRQLQRPAAFGRLPECNVYDIIKDKNGNLWLCTSAGLACYNSRNGTMRLFTAGNSQLPDDEVFCIGFDVNGIGWISTRSGMCLYEPAQRRLTTHGLPGQITQAGLMRTIMQYDRSSMIFIPQIGFPLVYDFNSGKISWLKFNIWEKNPSFLYAMKCRGGVLFCTEEGVYYSRGQKLRRFGYIDGLTSLQIQANAFSYDGRNTLYMATNGGLVKASLDRLSDTTGYHHIPIVPNEIQTDHWFTPEEVTHTIIDGRLRLNRSGSDFSLTFTPLIYGNIKGIKYRYRLEGIDRDWKMASHTRKIFYHSLFPGTYRLHIEAAGMPEINTVIEVDVPLTWTAIWGIIFLLTVFGMAGHIVYCKIKKKEYIWERFLPKPQIVKYKNNKLDKKQAEAIIKNLNSYMESKKPYLNPDLTMGQLAKGIGCQMHTLSQIFSMFLNRTYYDYVNEYRVREFVARAQRQEYSRLTVMALAETCGFRSRTPFFTAVRKFTGKLPSDFIKK